jgi:hypothetical protein
MNNDEEDPGLTDMIKHSKRNFYMSLFKIYSEMPFSTCMKNFAKIYNDVFSFEKPANVQKYFLTEVSVIEFIPPLSSTEDMKQSKRPFGNKIPMQKRCSYNFVRGTSRFVQYSNSRPFMDFLANAV